MDVSELARHVWSFGVPGVEGFVTYHFHSNEIFPQFPKPFNNPTNEQREKFHLFFHKHGFYDYEAEYRIVLFQDGPVMLRLPDKLIQSVSTSPFGLPNEELNVMLRSRFGEKLR